MNIYLDHNATTPVLPEVLEAMLPFYTTHFGNPSSIHWAGRAVKGALEEAREKVAALVKCDPQEVVFTSCGTEAGNMAIKGVAAALRDRGNHLITTKVEHPAVVNTCLYLEQNGYRITWLDVDRHGIPDLDRLESAISPETILVSVMFANNETGVLMPVREIAEIAERHRIYFHSDAVQAVGKVPVDVREVPIRLLSLSGHKIHAPKGVGALIVKKGVKIYPLLHGGSQERNRRAGTENLAGIVALGKACELAALTLQEMPKVQALRDHLEQHLCAAIPSAIVVGAGAGRLPNTSCMAFPGTAADSLLLNLDLAGIAVSSGSACSSGTMKNSPVLSAMGLAPDMAASSLRFSLGKGNSSAEIEHLLQVLPPLVARLSGSR